VGLAAAGVAATFAPVVGDGAAATAKIVHRAAEAKALVANAAKAAPEIRAAEQAATDVATVSAKEVSTLTPGRLPRNPFQVILVNRMLPSRSKLMHLWKRTAVILVEQKILVQKL
jgi:hypothetical protein